MKLRDLMVATILFSVLLAGSAMFYTNLFTNYGKATPEKLSTMDTVKNMSTQMETLKSQADSISKMNLESVWSLLGAIPNAINILIKIPTLAIQTVTEAMGNVPLVPQWAVLAVEAIILIVAIMMIISAIQKYRM